MRVRAAVGWLVMVGALVSVGSGRAFGQASAMPSAQAGPEAQPTTGETSESSLSKGRNLLRAMVVALGGDAWMHRTDWVYYGRIATFYQGKPNEGAPAFEEYYRAEPAAERILLISHSGVLIATDHRDVAEVWVGGTGYEVTYKGSKELPQKEVADYERRKAHSLEVIVHDWLQQPGVLVTYEGTTMQERRLAEQVSVLTANNDAVTMTLDANSHLPLSISFQWRDPVYKDLNTEVQEFDDYHPVQGIETPFAITRLLNGEMTGQRFLTKAVYNSKLPEDLFDPKRLLQKKAK
jgi:hypothetical protein